MLTLYDNDKTIEIPFTYMRTFPRHIYQLNSKVNDKKQDNKILKKEEKPNKNKNNANRYKYYISQKEENPDKNKNNNTRSKYNISQRYVQTKTKYEQHWYSCQNCQYQSSKESCE